MNRFISRLGCLTSPLKSSISFSSLSRKLFFPTPHSQLLPKNALLIQRASLSISNLPSKNTSTNTSTNNNENNENNENKNDPFRRTHKVLTPWTVFGLLLGTGASAFTTYHIMNDINTASSEYGLEWESAQTYDEDDFSSVTVGHDQGDISYLYSSRKYPFLLSLLVFPLRLVKRSIIATAYTLRLLCLSVRFAPLMVILGSIYAAEFVYNRLTSTPSCTQDDSPFSGAYTLWWQWFGNSLQNSGPAFVKLGQYLSARPDVLSPHICNILGSMRDDTEAHSWQETERILERELGFDWYKYISIQGDDKVPVGSGCIAQVYKGSVVLNSMNPDQDKLQLHTDSPVAGVPAKTVTVAIKVIHPSSKWTVTRDLKLLILLSSLAECLPLAELKFASPSSLMVEFSRLMHSQLDLCQEARNLDRFENNFNTGRADHTNIIRPLFPKVLLARKKVLVESYHTGIPMNKLIEAGVYNQGHEGVLLGTGSKNTSGGVGADFGDLSSADVDISALSTKTAEIMKQQQLKILNALTPDQAVYLRKAVAQCGLDTFLHMLFAHGFFHADLHPGNMIIDLGYDAMHDKEIDILLQELKKRQQINNHTTSTGTVAKKSFEDDSLLRARVVDKYFGPAPYDPSLTFPSQVFGLLHPDDLNTHPAYHQSENVFKSHFSSIGLPQPQSPPRLVMIDAGMATALSHRDKNNFNDLFYCIATGRGEEGAKLLIERARPIKVGGTNVSVSEVSKVDSSDPNVHVSIIDSPEPIEDYTINGHTVYLHSLPYNPYQTREDRESFIRDVSVVINAAASHGFNLSTLGVVSTLTSLLSAARNYHVKLDTSFISVVIAVTIMEGVGRSLDDKVDVVGPACKIVAATKLKEVQKDIMKKIDE